MPGGIQWVSLVKKTNFKNTDETDKDENKGRYREQNNER